MIDIRLNDLTNVVNKNAEILNQHGAFIDQETAAKILNFEKEIIIHAIEKSKAYTQVVLAGGYVGFFAFWSFMRGKSGEVALTLSGLLMAISLALFVIYVVVQNISSNRVLLNRVSAMAESGHDPAKYLEIKAEYDERTKGWLRRTFRSWYYMLIATVVPAVLSLAILLYGYVTFLVDQVDWNAIGVILRGYLE